MRPDLLALTRPALVALSNLGFVKRAEKDLAEGAQPTVVEGPDGGVTAVLSDGARVVIAPGKSLREAACTACTTAMCRHRIAAVLAYQAQGSATAAPQPAGPWSPGDVTDEALERLLGAAPLARAAATRSRGVIAEVQRGAGEEVPLVHLATSSVRFLVPRDVSHARCDCTLRTACEHVALAVWAFRAADRRDPAGAIAILTVELEGSRSGSGALDPAVELALEATLDVAAQVALDGVTRLGPAAATRFALARKGVERSGLAWIAAALDELEAQTEAYARRSALYAPTRLAGVVAELFGRVQAAREGQEVPPRAVLGADEALEAPLEQVRLVGLGARVTADEDTRVVRTFLADVGAASVLVLERTYARPPDAAPEDGAGLARRGVVAGTSLGVVARGQLLSNAAVRRASRAVSFSTGPLRKTSVLAGSVTTDALPAALVVETVEALRTARVGRAPRALRPRLLAESLRVFRVAQVAEVTYDPSAQAVVATCVDPAGGRFVATLGHRAVTPGALGVCARALTAGLGPVHAIVGEARVTGAGVEVELVSIFADSLVVPDLEPVTPEGEAALAALGSAWPHAAGAPGSGLVVSPLGAALARAADVLVEGVHQGLRGAGSAWRERVSAARARLDELGCPHAARALDRVGEALAGAQLTGAPNDERALVAAWARASLRLELLAEEAL